MAGQDDYIASERLDQRADVIVSWLLGT